MKHDFIENNIIILSKQTLDILLKEKKPSDLIALYCFYYYTAKWQKTNQPKATISYIAKGLNWGKDKARRNKQILIRLNLIEDVRDIDKKTKKIKGWYIKIKYIWKKESHPINSPEGGLSQRVAFSDPNALSDNNINALSANKETNNNIISSNEEKEFSLKKELESLRANSKRKDYKIIADYIEKKGFVFDNKEQYLPVFKRCLTSAKYLKGYNQAQIQETIEYCISNYPEIWTLETVLKRIPDVINKK
jgi:hypothetical protein